MKVLKNSKYQTHKKSIKLTKTPNDRTGAPGGPFSIFSTSIVAKHQKIEGALWGKNFQKKSHIAEKTERGTL